MRAAAVPAAAAALLAACGSGTPATQSAAAFPHELSLPAGVNQDCGCILHNQCAMLEQIPGHMEYRAISCRWVEEGETARCSFESRFVELGAPEGLADPPPTPWRPGILTARHLGGGRWCAENPPAN